MAKRRWFVLAVAALAGTLCWVAIGGAVTRTETIQLNNSEVGDVLVPCPGGKRVVLGGLKAQFDTTNDARIYVDELSLDSNDVLRVGGYGPGVNDANLTGIATCERKPRSQEIHKTVPADSRRVSATTHCPKGRRIVFGGFRGDLTAPSEFVLPAAAFAEHGRRWTVKASNDDDPGQLTALAYCGNVPKPEERSKTASLVPNSRKTVTARCKRGERLAYGGFDAGLPYSHQLNLTRLERSGSREWKAGFFNDQDHPIKGTALAYCTSR